MVSHLASVVETCTKTSLVGFELAFLVGTRGYIRGRLGHVLFCLVETALSRAENWLLLLPNLDDLVRS